MAEKGSKRVTASTALVKTDVPQILEKLEAKIASLKRIEDTPYKTTGNLTGFGDLKKETKIENLIRGFSMIQGKHDGYYRAAEELGWKTVPVFTIDGGSVEDWKHDIQLRMEIINYQDTLNTLKGYKDKMSSFLSAEDQKTILLNEMAAFLGSPNLS